jgi:ATP-dependent DNA ligase
MDPEADEAIAALPVPPPIEPMLARLVRDVPTGDFIYEPKWDGFRCLAFKSGPDVDLRSRHDRPLARYFPELVAAFRALPAERVVLDGEIVLVAEAGFDFALLLSRLHPAASRVERLSREAPARYIAFDILAEGDVDLTNRPFVERRRRLEALFEVTSPGEPSRSRRRPGTRTGHGSGSRDFKAQASTGSSQSRSTCRTSRVGGR